MMYIHSNNEIDKEINVSKIANNISTMGAHGPLVGHVGYVGWMRITAVFVWLVL